MIFKIQFLFLDYCPSSSPEFYLSSIALILYFKVVLAVALFGYMIRLFL